MSEETNVQKPSLFGMIWSPTEQFERLKERPKIWGALVIITILFIIGTWLTTLGIQTEVPGLTAEETEMINVFAAAGSVIGGLFIPIITILISSFINFLIAKIARSEVSFKQLFSMSTYIMIISALSLIVNSLLSLMTGTSPEILVSSLGSVVNADGAVGALFNSIEIFAIWGYILTAIGLQKVAGFSKGLAWGVQIAFFVIGIILAMIGAGIGEMVGV